MTLRKVVFSICRTVLLCLWGLSFSNYSEGEQNTDTLRLKLSLKECIGYALANQPLIGQSKLDEAITNKDIMISLSGWLPQLNVNANLQHYIQLPTSVFPDIANPLGPKLHVSTGLLNTSEADFSATQVIYSTPLLFARTSVHDMRTQAHQNTENYQINTIVDVSKAFYDALLTEEQIQVLDEDIQRLGRNYEDAYSLFKNGLTDKIDYKQALIALNNARAQQKNTTESLKGKLSLLKQLMGFPPEKVLELSYDSATLEKETVIDTMQLLSYPNRVEYQMLETDMKLQHSEIGYYRWSFLPTLSAFYNYNLIYFNNDFPPLYNTSYPNSLIGLKLTLPLFQGTNRLQNLRKAHLQYQRLELGVTQLKNRISTEYTESLGSYKGNLYALNIAKTNTEIAREVFNTVKLQYTEGIKTYLEVIVSETDLRTAQLNYLSALFQVLSSKLDVKKSLGTISVNNP